jgi:glycosyltransferase involved in cell wall biosynthesis
MTEAGAGRPVAVVIPACNEARTIGGVIARVRAVMPDADVLVVDDGSTDGTPAAAAAAGARVIRHPYNQGNGAAVKSALRQIHAETMVVVDADGQHPPEMIPALVHAAETYDLAIGARTASSHSSLLRRLGNWFFCRLASFLSRRPIADLTSGFRAFSRAKALEFIHLYPNGFSFPTTSTLAFISAGYSVTFVPIVAASRVSGTNSHIRPIRDGLRFVLIIVRIATMIDPLRVFVPAAALAMAAGVAWTAWTLWLTGETSTAGALLVGAGINILFFGIVVDQLAAIRIRGRDR